MAEGTRHFARPPRDVVTCGRPLAPGSFAVNGAVNGVSVIFSVLRGRHAPSPTTYRNALFAHVA